MTCDEIYLSHNIYRKLKKFVLIIFSFPCNIAKKKKGELKWCIVRAERARPYFRKGLEETMEAPYNY